MALSIRTAEYLPSSAQPCRVAGLEEQKELHAAVLENAGYWVTCPFFDLRPDMKDKTPKQVSSARTGLATRIKKGLYPFDDGYEYETAIRAGELWVRVAVEEDAEGDEE